GEEGEAMATVPAVNERSRGRGYLWAGLGVCVLGLALAVAQVALLRYLATPWYSPALATLGLLLLLVAVVKRPTVVRILALLLVAALAGWLWFGMGLRSKLPAYEGPAQVGKK